MAIGLVLQFEGVTVRHYEDVMEILELTSPAGERPGAWPAGLISHMAGPKDDGDLVVIDVWESQDAFDAFMGSALGPAMAKVGVPEPRVTRFDVYNAKRD